MTTHGPLREDWARELEAWEQAGRLREILAPAGVDFFSNDTLGLAREDRVIQAATQALQTLGAGSGASRLLGGGHQQAKELEEQVARWLGEEEAILFPSGYQANLALLTTVAGVGDAFVSDAANHASLIDGMRLSRARVEIYRHGDLEDADRALRAVGTARRRLLVTESVFSMDGDLAPLPELLGLCARHGASLLVDEAHGIGLLGPRGTGLVGECQARGHGEAALWQEHLAARIITGGKALGVAGALVVGRPPLTRLLFQKARPLMFTTAPAPAVIAALQAALGVLQDADQERRHCRDLCARLAEVLGLPTPGAAILPVPVGASSEALAMAQAIRAEGLDVRAIRPPTVAEHSARLRVVCHAFNTEEEVSRLAAAIQRHQPRAVPLQGVDPVLRPSTGPVPAWFVAGTDTGVGKTVVSALVARFLGRHRAGTYWKVVQTGDDDDTSTVRACLAGTAAAVAEPGCRFDLPASPHEAAAAEHRQVEADLLVEQWQRLREDSASQWLLAELAGGLLVPWREDLLQVDWLARRRAPVLLVARSGLGTLNHTLLSLEALRRRRVPVAALFLVGPPHASNRETLRRLGQVEHVLEVPWLEEVTSASLDACADALDLEALWPA